MARQRNASIEGIGSIYGGKLDGVSINGIGKIKGDAEIGCFDINGIGKATGKLTTETINNNGIVRLIRDTKSKKIVNNGVFKATHNIEAEEFISDGLISIWKTATVDNFKASFMKGSYVHQLLGDLIEIKLADKLQHTNVEGPLLIFKLVLGGKLVFNKFVCDTIECTSLKADNLVANTVRARDIVLGPNSEVEYLEYSNSFTAHESCIIKKAVKI